MDKQCQLPIIYNVAIKDGGKYWYEIIVDGKTKLKVENKNPKTFSKVYLYASSPWYETLSSTVCKICNVKVQHGFGKYKQQFYEKEQRQPPNSKQK